MPYGGLEALLHPGNRLAVEFNEALRDQLAVPPAPKMGK